MHHPRYCLTHHPGISSNITHATHVSTPSILPILVHHPCHPRQHVIHAGMSPTLARHHRKRTTHANRALTQARRLRDPRQHKEHTISQNPGYPINSEIPRENLAVFTFSSYLCSLYFLGFLKHFHGSLENCHRKIKLFQRRPVCLIQKTTIFGKTNAYFFQKKLFPNFSVVSVILYIISLEKQFIKNQYYLYQKF